MSVIERNKLSIMHRGGMLIEPNQYARNASGKNGSQMDDNDAILRLLKKRYPFEEAVRARLDLGRERYGHGIRVEDDTTQWGTKTDSWLEMGLEEIDDLAIYVAAQLSRSLRGYDVDQSFPATEYHELMKSLAEVRKQIVDLMENNG